MYEGKPREMRPTTNADERTLYFLKKLDDVFAGVAWQSRWHKRCQDKAETRRVKG